ncbi:MAG: biotin--[acetyl-CoA-carboxylase] ligase [Phycisphaeraceae bacterium]
MQSPVIDVRLLELLLDRREPTPLPAIAHALTLDERTAQRELERLRRAGCRLDEHPHGVRLVQTGITAWRDYLEAIPAAGRPPGERHVAVYRQTASTQEAARELAVARGRDADGALAVADEQTAGRGRLGRSWLAPPGTGVTFSRVRTIAPDDASAVERLTFAAAVCVADAMATLLAGRAVVSLKWPNDVCVGERKLAGILVETAQRRAGERFAIIGVGVNVGLAPGDLPPELAPRVTSLAMEGVEPDRLAVLAAVDRALDDALHRRPLDELLEQWRYRCGMLHRHVELWSGGRPVRGQVVDLDPHAGLILRTAGGELLHLPAATTSARPEG